VANNKGKAGEAVMIWTVIVLLVIIAVLLGWIAWMLDAHLTWVAELTRASGQANVRHLIAISTKLDEIERHAAQIAKPYFEGESQGWR